MYVPRTALEDVGPIQPRDLLAPSAPEPAPVEPVTLLDPVSVGDRPLWTDPRA